MDVFSLAAKLTLDSSKYNTGLSDAQKSAYAAKSTLASLAQEATNAEGGLREVGSNASNAANRFVTLESELRETSMGLQVTRSELNEVSSRFIGAEKSTAALSAQNEVLERTTYDLNEKLRIQEELLRAAETAFGSSSEQAMRYREAINNTNAELNKVNAQIASNTEQINRNEQSNSGLNAILGKVGINIGDVAQKFGLSSDAAGTLTRVLGSAAAGYTAVAASAVKAIDALNDFAEKYAAQIDTINTLARNYHMAAETIQELNYTAPLIDVSTQTITTSISRLTRSMAGAKDGTGDAAEAFKRLDVEIMNANGTFRDSNDVFYDVIDALGRIESVTDQDALALQIFGRSAMDLRGVIDAGSEGMRAYAEEAQRAGVVLSNEANARLQKLQDTKDRVDAVQEGLKQKWASLWAPAANFFEELKGGFLLIASKATDALLAFGDGADKTAESIRELNDALTTLDGQQILKGSIRDITPEDLLTEEQRSYQDYVRRALKFQEETGQKVTIYSRQVLKDPAGYYAGNYNSHVNVSVQLDGRELAHTSYQYGQDEAALRGGSIR